MRTRARHRPGTTGALTAVLAVILVLAGDGALAASPTPPIAPGGPAESLVPGSPVPAISPAILADVSPAASPEPVAIAPGGVEGAVPNPLVPTALIYPPPTEEQVAGLKKIKHIVIIVQENRSFDHYFGTFPGAEGIPMKADGKTPIACLKNPTGGPCVRPYHDKNLVDAGGPHHLRDHVTDVNNGRMDGFIKAVWREPGHYGCTRKGQVRCMPGSIIPDVMGYKTDREIPNYWTYARRFGLQDHLFEPVRSYSLPAHLYLVSAWSARCKDVYDPMSCTSAIAAPPKDSYDNGRKPLYAWTDITYLLRRSKISWRYYVGNGTPVDCGDGAGICKRGPDNLPITTPMLWNPLNYFTTVQQARQADNIQHHREFFKDLKNGKLAQVVWITPNHRNSEHQPDASIDDGQAWVTQLVNKISRSKFWKDTAIFITWDDWGGFYDHVPPPMIDKNGYGIRVPGLLISPYARRGFIDKQMHSFDSYLKFIEDVFLDGQRLDPKTMSRPDSRPTVRENVRYLGDLIHGFDFTQEPLDPVILPLYPSRKR